MAAKTNTTKCRPLSAGRKAVSVACRLCEGQTARRAAIRRESGAGSWRAHSAPEGCTRRSARPPGRRGIECSRQRLPHDARSTHGNVFMDAYGKGFPTPRRRKQKVPRIHAPCSNQGRCRLSVGPFLITRGYSGVVSNSGAGFRDCGGAWLGATQARFRVQNGDGFPVAVASGIFPQDA